MSILTRLLEKKGIKSPEELTPEERVDFDNWKKVLSKEDIKLSDVEEFCASNIRNIEAKFKDLDNSKEKIERLVLLHSVYSSMKNLINSPRAEREQLENYLTQLL